MSGLRVAVATCLILVAVYYLGSTLFAVWHYGFEELWADQFRQYAGLLSRPFWEGVFAPDNSHRQVTSNLFRLWDIALGGDQRVLIGAGCAFIVAAFASLLFGARLGQPRDALALGCVAVLAALCVGWMGAARMLFHGNEAIQTYFIIACVAWLIVVLEQERLQTSWLWRVLAVAIASVALLTFAAGVAAMGLLMVWPLIRRHSLRVSTQLIAAALGITALSMFVLPGDDSIRAPLQFAPLNLLKHFTAWTSSTPMTGWLLYRDEGFAGVNAARMGITQLGAVLVGSAQMTSTLLGAPSKLALASGVGLFGIACYAWQLLALWRGGRALPYSAQVFGTGLATFALGVGFLVCLGRTGVFAADPGQVLAERYLPWTNLFWFGLALVAVAALARRGRVWIAAVLVFGLATMSYPTHRAMYGWVGAVARSIESHAAAAQAGVWRDDFLIHADTPDLATLQARVDRLRVAEVAMFRHPRARLQQLELRPELAAKPAWTADPLAVAELGSGAGDARWVWGMVDPALRTAIDGIVVVDPSGKVVGFGEFSFRRVDFVFRPMSEVADGFDAYFRCTPEHLPLRLIGVDAAVQHAVEIGHMDRCL